MTFIRSAQISKTSALLAAVASACFLTACGGGDPDPANTQASQAAPVQVGNLLMTMPSNPYPVGSAEQRGFDSTNVLRIKGGFGAASYSAEMTKAAAAHVIYQIADGGVGHYEVVGKTGFTGVTPQDRCTVAAMGTPQQGKILCSEGGAYQGGSLSEMNIASAYTLATGHLQDLLRYQANYMGMNFDSFVSTPYMISADGVRTALSSIPAVMGTVVHGTTSAPSPILPADKANSIVGIYPYDGMKGVGIGSAGSLAGEIFQERPVPGASWTYWDGSGLNIMAQFPGSENPEVTVFTLRKEGDTVDTPARIHQAGLANGTEPTLKGWAILVANKLLEKNVKYNVTLRGKYKGVPFDKSWSFTTGDRSHSIM